MTGDKSKFLSLENFKGGNVIMGDNSKCKIIGKGEVGNGIFSLTNVLYVDNLHHNLISISQLCDKGMMWSLIVILAKLLINLLVTLFLWAKEKGMFTHFHLII